MIFEAKNEYIDFWIAHKFEITVSVENNSNKSFELFWNIEVAILNL